MSEKFELNKEQIVTQDFLAEQISLPREAWSDEFKKYISQKIEENRQRSESAAVSTKEEERIETFNRYIKGLNLSTEDLRDKVVFDLGCGDGEFVEECIDQGVSDTVYGIDERELQRPDKYPGHFFTGSFEDPLPIGAVDYAVSLGAISVFENIIDCKKTLKNALSSLGDNGEIRIYPIQKAPEDSDLEGLKESYKRWNKLMPEVASEEGVQWKLMPIDIAVGGNNNDVWLQEVLVIKKRLNEDS